MKSLKSSFLFSMPSRYFAALILVIMVTCSVLFAEGPIDVTPVDFNGWLMEVITWVLSIKGAAVITIVVGVTQLLMKLFKTAWGSGFLGKYQLLVLSLLTVGSLVAGGVSTGLTVLQAIMQGPVLAAMQVFVYEVIKQFTQKA